jgi:plastocyanin
VVPRGLVLLLALLLVAPACGSEEGSEPVATTKVTMVKSYRFEPETITIEAGQTVTWTNDDNFTHTVQVEIEGQGDHEVGKGKSVSITFDEPGTYDYVCTLHSHDMKGKVIVT